MRLVYDLMTLCDSKESLVLLTEEEINELSSTITMKAGHKKRFPIEIRKAREEIQLEERRKEEEMEEIQLEQDLAKLQRDEVLREAQALAKTKARMRDDQENETKADTKPIAPKSIAAQHHETQKGTKENMQDTAAGGKGAQNLQPHQALPAGKRFHFFASHSEYCNQCIRHRL